MKKVFAVLLLTMLFALAVTSFTSADDGQPHWGCPDDFHLHEAVHHDDDHDGDHKHVGSGQDKNGDGWICVKHATPSEKIHVHIDNNIPLP
jgi:hypothetical protein